MEHRGDEPSHIHREPLSYATPEPAQISPGVVCGTSIGTCLALMATVFASILGSIESSGAALWSIPAVLLVLIVIAVRTGRVPARRSVSIGIWVGIGLALLVEGACFGISRFR